MDKRSKETLIRVIKSHRGKDTFEPKNAKQITLELVKTLGAAGKTIKIEDYIFHMLRSKSFRHKVLSSTQVAEDLCSTLESSFTRYGLSIDDGLGIPPEVMNRIEEDDKKLVVEEPVVEEPVVEEPVVEEPVVEEPVVEEPTDDDSEPDEEAVVEEPAEESVDKAKEDLSKLFEKKKKRRKAKKSSFFNTKKRK